LSFKAISAPAVGVRCTNVQNYKQAIDATGDVTEKRGLERRKKTMETKDQTKRSRGSMAEY
jgi:hypothetical protein